ncbi:hypothetical protein BC826DRAFT_972302 [Russula brevipes]|nr:hypothetical protein BC826DRAFT_972302 [Russula brevipes]
MSAKRTSQQPNASDTLWGTNSQLTRDDFERNVLPLDQYLGSDVQGRTSVDSGALATGSSVIPTPLPTSDDAALSSGWGPGLQRNDDANLQANWESDGLVEVQLENPEPSSGGPGSQQGEQRRGRRKEESGMCDLCHHWFSRKSDVKRHKNTAHAKEVHACPQCRILRINTSLGVKLHITGSQCGGCNVKVKVKGVTVTVASTLDYAFYPGAVAGETGEYGKLAAGHTNNFNESDATVNEGAAITLSCRVTPRLLQSSRPTRRILSGLAHRSKYIERIQPISESMRRLSLGFPAGTHRVWIFAFALLGLARILCLHAFYITAYSKRSGIRNKPWHIAYYYPHYP